MEEEIDYKDLLIKYIQHVTNCEGINFIDRAGYGDDYVFTDKEKETLIELAYGS